jgi:hypothetical protein
MNNKYDPSEFSTTIELLEKMDPGTPSSKERIYNRLASKLENKGQNYNIEIKDGISMKKSWRAKAVTATVVLCLGGAFSATSYAQDMLQSVLARFEVGNMKITQYDKEIPPAAYSPGPDEGKEASRSGVVELPEAAKLTVDEARAALGLNFPAPGWMGEYEYVNTVLHGSSMAEVQYKAGDKTVNFLISKGGENGISTTDEVKTEVIGGTKVYYANGIVLWEADGFTVELYAREDFDSAKLGKIMGSFAAGAPVKELSKEQVEKNLEKYQETRRAAPAPAPANP